MKQRIAYKTPLFVLASFTLLWFLLILLSKTMFSGYHFMDDSIIISYKKIIDEHGLWYAINDYMSTDLKTRLRPVWVVEFISGIYIKGDHFVLWAFVRALWIALTNTLFFAFAFNSGLSLRKSILFSLLIMLGQQAAILWMLGPAEVSGIFFLGLTLFAIPFTCDKKPFYPLLFITSAALMSLSKESFIFMLPAVYIWLLWNHSVKYHKTLFQSLSEYIFTGSILLAIMLAELFCVYKISLNFNYAGADKSLGISSYIKAFVFLLILSISGLVSLCGFAILFLKKQFRPKKWIFPLLLSAAIILPQVVIYTKSGFAERYFLPAVIGFVVLIIYQLQVIDKDPTNYNISKKVTIGLSLFSAAVLASGLILALSPAFRLLVIKTMYGFRGAAVQAMNPIEQVVARSDGNIRVIGWGVTAIALVMISGYITVIMLKIKAFRMYHGFMSIVLLCIGVNLVSVFGLARKFAKEGDTVHDFLTAIIDHTTESGAILVVSDHIVQQEATYSGLPVYLTYKADCSNLFAYPVSLSSEDSLPETENFIIPTRAYKPFVIQAYDCIALFPETEKPFLKRTTTWFSQNEYIRRELQSGYVIYHKRK